MADNINLMQELLRHYGRKRASLRCIIKIDFRKAFNSIQWLFLQHLLLLLGFPVQFVHLIIKCVETTSYFVSMNGDLFEFFNGKCGVCQGDPLSPYLFIVCVEYFSRMLKQCTHQSDFNFHPKCSALRICHLAFANDIFFLGVICSRLTFFTNNFSLLEDCLDLILIKQNHPSISVVLETALSNPS